MRLNEKYVQINDYEEPKYVKNVHYLYVWFLLFENWKLEEHIVSQFI